jgi:PHD/YefM family antitoxin component YafN of YafNO toxin-antitoxin module
MSTVQTISSRDFLHNISAAKRLAAQGPVFITDRGKPTFALMSIEEYRRMSQGKDEKKNMFELLSMPEVADFEIPQLEIHAQEVEL